MLDILLCYAHVDREAADTIAAYIERGAEAKVWREECDPAQGETVAQAWETGLSSAAILAARSAERRGPSLPTRTCRAILIRTYEGGSRQDGVEEANCVGVAIRCV